MNEDTDHSPGEESNFQAFATLQKSDPATNVAPADLQNIRAKVTTDEGPVSLAKFARVRQLPKWSYAATAAVVALGIGTGAGYSVAAHNSKPTTSQVVSDTGSISAICVAGTGPCMDTPGPGPNQTGSTGQTSALGSRLSSSKLDASVDGLSGRSVWNGRPWFTPGPDITDTAGQSVGYIFSDAGLDRHALLRKLITAFSIDGAKTTSDNYNLQITSKTPGEGLSIGGADDQLLNFWYDNPASGPNACYVSEPDAPKVPSNGESTTPTPRCSVITGPVVSRGSALDIAKNIFGQAGLDLENVSWETNSGADYFGTDSDNKPQPYIQVVAHMLVDQQDSQLAWTMDIAPDKSIVHASGYLSKPVATATYDIVGAKTAVLRSQDLKWSTYGPEILNPGQGLGDVGQVPDTSPTRDSQGRPVLPLILDEAVITSSEPGLYGMYLDGYTYALLPAYKLCDAKNCWMQVAVADKYLVTR